MKKLVSPPSRIPFIDKNGDNDRSWTTWLFNIFERLDKAVVIPAYIVADLTTANGLAPADWADSTFTGIIYVTDAAGGASTAYSDGTNWISHKTGTAV